MLQCSFSLAAARLLVEITSALQKSQCCSATSAAQHSKNCSATSVFACGMLQGWGLEGWGLGLADLKGLLCQRGMLFADFCRFSFATGILGIWESQFVEVFRIKSRETQQTRVYPYPLGAGPARPNPKMGAPDPESPLFPGFSVLKGPSETMVSDHGLGRGQTMG